MNKLYNKAAEHHGELGGLRKSGYLLNEVSYQWCAIFDSDQDADAFVKDIQPLQFDRGRFKTGLVIYFNLK